MDAEGHELGRFTPVPDALVLAAVQRAQRHGGKTVLGRDIAAHLGFVHSLGTTRKLRPQLESLRVAGSLECARRHGLEAWKLTATGARRLATARRAGKVGALPESPQHRRWRQARAEAEARYDDFRTQLYLTLEAAEDAAEPPEGTSSETWLELGERLAAAFWLMRSATYCRDEWPEPEDAQADRDDAPRGQLGRRNFEDWKQYEAAAKGDFR